MKKVYFLIAFFLASCAQFEPFVDARREAGQAAPVGQSTLDRVAICYNPLWSNEQEIEKLAAETCAQTKRKPVFDDKTYFNCAFVSPATAFYKCINPS